MSDAFARVDYAQPSLNIHSVPVVLLHQAA